MKPVLLVGIFLVGALAAPRIDPLVEGDTESDYQPPLSDEALPQQVRPGSPSHPSSGEKVLTPMDASKGPKRIPVVALEGGSPGLSLTDHRPVVDALRQRLRSISPGHPSSDGKVLPPVENPKGPKGLPVVALEGDHRPVVEALRQRLRSGSPAHPSSGEKVLPPVDAPIGSKGIPVDAPEEGTYGCACETSRSDN